MGELCFGSAGASPSRYLHGCRSPLRACPRFETVETTVLDTADKSQSSRHIPCAVRLKTQPIFASIRHGGACRLLLSAVSFYSYSGPQTVETTVLLCISRTVVSTVPALRFHRSISGRLSDAVRMLCGPCNSCRAVETTVLLLLRAANS